MKSEQELKQMTKEEIERMLGKSSNNENEVFEFEIGKEYIKDIIKELEQEKWEGYLENIKKETTQEISEIFETVNHPKHYNRDGAMECIDEMILLYGIDAVIDFCLCNAHKYRYRASCKNGEDDLKKSDWYINKYKELKEQNGQ